MDFSSSEDSGPEEEEEEEVQEEVLDFAGPLIGPIGITYCGGGASITKKYAYPHIKCLHNSRVRRLDDCGESAPNL